MAVNVLANVASALSQRFLPRVARQYNRQTILLSELDVWASPMQGVAKNVAFDAVLGDNGQQYQAAAEGTAMASSEFTTDNIVPGTLPWAIYRNGFAVSDTEFDAAVASIGSATAVENMLMERILSATTALADGQNIDAWSGTGTALNGNPNIIGFQGGALAASGTYAGISRSTYPSFGGNVLANGGVARPLSFDLLAQGETEIFVGCGMKPQLMVASPNVWRKYSSLFEPLRRFNDDQRVYNTSTDVLQWRGIPIVRDKDGYENPAAGTGTLLMLNKDHCKLACLSPTEMSRQDVWKVQDKPGSGSNGEPGGETSIKVPFRIIPLARVGDYMQFMVKSTVQLVVDRPNASCIIQDISIV
jgi:hypothetical protein